MAGKAAGAGMSYKGKSITLAEDGDKATITIDGSKFAATRTAGMWRVQGVHNPYRDLGALSRHIVDYMHLFQAK